jgi:hypothetical protein
MSIHVQQGTCGLICGQVSRYGRSISGYSFTLPPQNCGNSAADILVAWLLQPHGTTARTYPHCAWNQRQISQDFSRDIRERTFSGTPLLVDDKQVKSLVGLGSPEEDCIRIEERALLE